jgi:hypothetical protein
MLARDELSDLELALFLRGISLINNSVLTTEEKKTVIRLRSELRSEVKIRGIKIREE